MLVITAIISCLTINSIVRSAVLLVLNNGTGDCTDVFVGRIPREGSTQQWRCRRQTATGRGRVGCCHGYACRTPQPPRACVCPWARLWKCSSCVIGSLGHGALWSFHSIKHAACLSWWFHVSAEFLRASILYWIQYSIIFVLVTSMFRLKNTIMNTCVPGELLSEWAAPFITGSIILQTLLFICALHLPRNYWRGCIWRAIVWGWLKHQSREVLQH